MQGAELLCPKPALKRLFQGVQDLGAGPTFRLAPRGEADQGRAAMRRIGPPLHVAALFQVVHQCTHGLLADPCPPRERADPRSAGVQVLKDGEVCRAYVGESRRGQPGVNLIHKAEVSHAQQVAQRL